MGKKKTPSKPLFVAISDIHFNLTNLSLSSQALTSALQKAEELNIPLIIAGDLNDTKAIIRAEVANELIRILKYAKVKIFILVGNHDLINEKGKDHCLNFLAPYATIVDGYRVEEFGDIIVRMLSYTSGVEQLKYTLKVSCLPGDIIVMHQGVQGANIGDYAIDKTSISPDELALFTCIGGHYHRHQTVGTLTYIGSPFTMSFGEANDGAKGFLVVASDGSFTRETLKLRKHVILEAKCTGDSFSINLSDYALEDLIWVKLEGTKSQLDRISKKRIAEFLGTDNFKFDKIPLISGSELPENSVHLTGEQILDQLIEQTKESAPKKTQLKKLWRASV